MRYLARFFVAMAAVMLSGVSMAQDVTVDNLDSGATSRVGPWSESSAPVEYLGSSFYSNDTKARFTFIPKLPEAGSYKVEVIWSYHPNRSTSVPHCIVDSDGQACENFNQRDSSADGVWTMLSGGPFNCGTDNCEVTVSAANGQASADAVRWTLLEPTPPPASVGSGSVIPVWAEMRAGDPDLVIASNGSLKLKMRCSVPDGSDGNQCGSNRQGDIVGFPNDRSPVGSVAFELVVVDDKARIVNSYQISDSPRPPPGPPRQFTPLAPGEEYVEEATCLQPAENLDESSEECLWTEDGRTMCWADYALMWGNTHPGDLTGNVCRITGLVSIAGPPKKP